MREFINPDILLRLKAFEHIEMLSKMHDHLTCRELSAGFFFQVQRFARRNGDNTRLRFAKP